MKLVLHHDTVLLALAHGPGGPAHEAVDRVLFLGVVDRELMAVAPELVAAVHDPVGPGEQDLSPPRRAHLVGSIPVEQLAARRRVGPQAAADLHDHGALVAERDLDLLPGRRRSGAGHRTACASVGSRSTLSRSPSIRALWRSPNRAPIHLTSTSRRRPTWPPR